LKGSIEMGAIITRPIRNIFFGGIPGGGKGTTAEGLVERFPGRFKQISTGNLIDSHIARETALGVQLKPFKVAGKLAPDALVNPMAVTAALEDMGDVIKIWDGYPRNLSQARFFSERVKFDRVFFIDTPDDVIVKRITNRRVCSNNDCKKTYNLISYPPKTPGVCDLCGQPLKQRSDDVDPKVIMDRLVTFRKETAPLKDFFGDQVITLLGGEEDDPIEAILPHLGLK
jgi:adenylate kinase